MHQLFKQAFLSTRRITPYGRGVLAKSPTALSAQARHPLGLPRPACSSSNKKSAESHCGSSKPTAAPSLRSFSFWDSKQVWKRAGVNTLRCLIGCTVGDFSAMWYLQAFHSGMGMEAIMAISMASGITSSLALETVLLRYGRDRLPWLVAAKTAAGMSMISMITMEAAENLVDYHLIGGAVDFTSPSFWGAAALSIGAGFLAPLPYNYVRLRKFGKACH